MQPQYDYLSVSVIVPVYQGGPSFRKCLESIKECILPPHEIVVVIDGATDNSINIAREFPTKVLKTSTRLGPAKARNMGARRATGEILFFVDADVSIRADAINLVVEALKEDSPFDAVFGSYDDQPFQDNFLSQYKNLFHHFIHQTSNTEAFTFWSGCGAIRRTVFAKMGGFDEQYDRPSIEDIELGYRLKNAGFRILLIASLQAKHYKRWNFFSLVKTDVLCRAIPWSYLILREGRFPRDLNLRMESRISIMLAYLLIFFLAGLFYLPWASVPAAFTVIVLLYLNDDLYIFFFKKRGLYFAFRSIGYHWLYYLYSGAAFAFAFIDWRLRRGISQRSVEAMSRDRLDRNP